MMAFTTVAYAQSGSAATTTFNNPLGGFSAIPDLLFAVVNILLIIAVPLMVFFIIYAGFNYVTAQGNPEKIAVANRSLMYSLIGAVVMLGAFAISAIITNVVCEFSDSPAECRSR